MLCKCRTKPGYRTRSAATLDRSESGRVGPTCSVATEWRRAITRNRRRGVSLAKGVGANAGNVAGCRTASKTQSRSCVIRLPRVANRSGCSATLVSHGCARQGDSRPYQTSVFDLPEPSELRGSVPCMFHVSATHSAKHFPRWGEHVFYECLYGLAGAADKCRTD